MYLEIGVYNVEHNIKINTLNSVDTAKLYLKNKLKCHFDYL